MEGQWFGFYEGTNSGNVVLNLDKRGRAYGGSASIVENDPSLPSVIYYATLFADESGRVNGHLDFHSFFDARSNAPISPERARELLPGPVIEARHIDFEGALKDGVVAISFKSDAQTSGTANLSRRSVGDHTIIEKREVSWVEFKSLVATKNMNRYLYRGQPAAKPLRTAFHRANRYDLLRFAIEDVSRLRNAIISVLDGTFDTSDPQIHAALLGIAQHHGFPTPLLDWTKSPYVGAYFACREVFASREIVPTIFEFDRSLWMETHQSAQDVVAPRPGLAFVEPIPLRNPRLLPQQSVLMYCNVDNFEDFVVQRERATKRQYLIRYQIIASPTEVLADLRKMGVFAGALFPGLDGICRGAFEDSVEA